MDGDGGGGRTRPRVRQHIHGCAFRFVHVGSKRVFGVCEDVTDELFCICVCPIFASMDMPIFTDRESNLHTMSAKHAPDLRKSMCLSLSCLRQAAESFHALAARFVYIIVVHS